MYSFVVLSRECSKGLWSGSLCANVFSSSEFMLPDLSFFFSFFYFFFQKSGRGKRKQSMANNERKRHKDTLFTPAVRTSTPFFCASFFFGPLCRFHESSMYASCKLFGTLNEHHVRFIWDKRRGGSGERERIDFLGSVCSIEPCLFTLPLRCHYSSVDQSPFILSFVRSFFFWRGGSTLRCPQV